MKTTSSKNYEVQSRCERKTRKEIYLEKMVMKWVWPFINGDYFVKIIFRHHNEHAFRGSVWWVCYQIRNRAVAPMANSHPVRDSKAKQSRERKKALHIEVAEFLVYTDFPSIRSLSFSTIQWFLTDLHCETKGGWEVEVDRDFVFLCLYPKFFDDNFYHCNKEREKSDIDDESRTPNTEKNAQ